MSMFSQHWLIRHPNKPKYWNGKLDDGKESCWNNYGGVRFHDKASAEAVCRGILPHLSDCVIERDE